MNPPGGSAHPFVSPDETILLLDRCVGPNDTNGDLFVSFRLPDGSWSEAQAVEIVNTDVTELAASLSPDGSILIFARGYRSTGSMRASSTRTVRWAPSAYDSPPRIQEIEGQRPRLASDSSCRTARVISERLNRYRKLRPGPTSIG